MGSHSSRIKAGERFDENEYRILKRTYEDLSKRSHLKSGLDINTFLLIFKYPGMLGKRMFNMFDNNNDMVIDFDEFIFGLGLVLRGTEEEKTRFLYNLFNLNNSDGIRESDMRTLLNSMILSYDDDNNNEQIIEDMIKVAFKDKNDDIVTLYEFGQWVLKYPELVNTIEHVLLSTKETVPLFDEEVEKKVLIKEVMTPKAVTNSFDIINIRNKKNNWKNSLNKKQATMLSGKKDLINCPHCNLDINFFFCYCCGSRLDGSFNCEQCGKIIISDRIIYCISCGFELANVPSTPSFASPAPKFKNETIKSKKEEICEGYLMKIGQKLHALKTRWYVIRDHFLYSYRRRTDLSPSSVIFLEGCFVEAKSSAEEKFKYGIEIIMSEEYGSKRLLFAKTAKERDKWICNIRIASNILNIETYYDILDELGVGRFSSVNLCKKKDTNEQYAVKIIDKSELTLKNKESLRTEIAILKLLNHPNVIQLVDQFETRSQIYIVMNLMSGGDLFDRLCKNNHFDEETSKQIIYKLCSVVKYLHDRGIIHRDLKLENIMCGEDITDIVLIDFGLSQFCAPSETLSLPCGTLAYCAPEILTNKGYTQAVDIWSVGVICYLLLLGKFPFDGKTRDVLIEQTSNISINFEGLTESSKNFIKSLLIVDSVSRPDAESVLSHPWLLNQIGPLNMNIINMNPLPPFPV